MRHFYSLWVPASLDADGPSEDLPGVYMLCAMQYSPALGSQLSACFFLGKIGPHHIHVQFKIVTNLYTLAASVAGAQVPHYYKSCPLLLHVYHLSVYSYKVS